MTIQEIKNYVLRNDYVVNPAVLITMINSLEQPKQTLPQVNVSKEKVLNGTTALDSEGNIITGTCNFNAKVPAVPTSTKWISKDELPEGVAALVLVNGIWTLIKK